MHQDELPDRRRHPGADIAEAENADADPDRGDDAVTVGDLAGQHAAGAEASITRVKASDAVPRLAPNSACTTGSATTTDHMPTLPSEPISTATASRVHARRESGTNRSESRVRSEEISTASATSSALPTGQAPCRDIGHADVVGSLSIVRAAHILIRASAGTAAVRHDPVSCRLFQVARPPVQFAHLTARPVDRPIGGLRRRGSPMLVPSGLPSQARLPLARRSNFVHRASRTVEAKVSRYGPAKAL